MNKPEGVAAPLCPTCKHAKHTSTCSHKTAYGVFCFCGVAAPLEPITAEQFYLQRHPQQPYAELEPEAWLEFAEAYAAAVSKNLQEELAESEQEAIELHNVVTQRNEVIMRLEKEIAR